MGISVDDLPEELQPLVKAALEELEPMSPEQAIESYLEYKESEIRPQTLSEYKDKLDHFRRFCKMREIDNVNDLDGRIIDNFRRYRRNESSSQSEPLSTKTMKDDMCLFRSFIRYLESIEAVSTNLSDKVKVPKLGKNDGVRNITIDPERVSKILEHLEQYEYASRHHVVWEYYAHTGRRPGSLYGLDLCDLHLDNEDPYIEVRHRPGETELKNGEDGEDEIHLSQHVANVSQEFIETKRIETTDEYGREPFLTSQHGRLSKSTMRKYIYMYTRPCVVSGECPHGRTVDTCEAAQYRSKASKCPSSKPPYALRHGYITAKRGQVPDRLLTGRCDVGVETLEKHYDERDESEKRQLRKQFFDELRDEEDEGGYR